jgi:hypothetical protein
MVSHLAPYGNSDALRVAQDLDAKIDTIMCCYKIVRAFNASLACFMVDRLLAIKLPRVEVASQWVRRDKDEKEN